MYERLRNGLARTRERLRRGLGLGAAGGSVDWEALEEALLGADVGPAAAAELLAAVRRRGAEDPRAALRDELLAILRSARPASAPAGAGCRVSLVVGVNGVGKTTTVAKLAYRSVREGLPTLVVAADTFRAAAVEQLETWAARAGASFVGGGEGADPASVVHEALQKAVASGVRHVLVDTAGRLHTKRPLMDELGKIGRVAGRLVEGAPHETLLVMDATVGTNGLAQARRFAEVLRLSGIVLTKLDGTARGGVVVAVARELGLPVRWVGLGEGLDDLVAFSAESFVDALLGDAVAADGAGARA